MVHFDRIWNTVQRDAILKVLPLAHDKTQKGKPRKEIARLVVQSPDKVSTHLQALKRQHRVRCYKGRWRQA